MVKGLERYEVPKDDQEVKMEEKPKPLQKAAKKNIKEKKGKNVYPKSEYPKAAFIPTSVTEHKELKIMAATADLSMTDYGRMKLGLPYNKPESGG